MRSHDVVMILPYWECRDALVRLLFIDTIEPKFERKEAEQSAVS